MVQLSWVITHGPFSDTADSKSPCIPAHNPNKFIGLPSWTWMEPFFHLSLAYLEQTAISLGIPRKNHTTAGFLVIVCWFFSFLSPFPYIKLPLLNILDVNDIFLNTLGINHPIFTSTHGSIIKAFLWLHVYSCQLSVSPNWYLAFFICIEMWYVRKARGQQFVCSSN